MHPNATTPEQWRPVFGWEGVYEVSDLGRVRTLARTFHRSDGRRVDVKARILKANINARGYVHVRLQNRGYIRDILVHRLVLLSFTGAPPAGYESLHINGNPSDDRLVNLHWGTKAENAADRRRHGRDKNLRKTHCIRGHEFTPENTKPLEGNRPDTPRRACLRCREAYNMRKREQRIARAAVKDPNP